MKKGTHTDEGRKVQERVFELVKNHIDDYGYPPTVRWIAKQTGRALSNVSYHLQWLEEEGRIERDPGVSRGIRIVDDVV